MPSVITFTDGNTITYGYDASGQKLSVTHLTATAGIVIPMTNIMTPLAPANIAITTKTDYCGNVIYENGALSKILTEEGYITFSGTTPVYHYYLKDHKGNNREVCSGKVSKPLTSPINTTARNWIASKAWICMIMEQRTVRKGFEVL